VLFRFLKKQTFNGRFILRRTFIEGPQESLLSSSQATNVLGIMVCPSLDMVIRFNEILPSFRKKIQNLFFSVLK